jgi:NADH-quinone oxidoreductase subunit J
MLNLFNIFAILLIVSSTVVVLSKHPIFSLLALVTSFLLASFILFLIECEFLAFLFIIIYVGAIAILFLFAIMMLDYKSTDLSRNTIKYLPIAVIFGLGFLSILLYEVNSNFEKYPSDSFYINIYQNWYDLIDSTTDVEVYGQVLYSYFVLQLLITGLILLMVLIGVVYLTNTYSVKPSNSEQVAFKQLARESKFFFKN